MDIPSSFADYMMWYKILSLIRYSVDFICLLSWRALVYNSIMIPPTRVG